MSKILNNKKGSALIIVLIVLMVLSVLGAAMINRSIADTKIAVSQENNMKA